MIDVGNSFQWVVEVCCQQCCNYTQAYEAHAYEETRLQCFSEFHTNAQAYDSKDDRHHHACAKADNVAKYLFHFLLLLFLIFLVDHSILRLVVCIKTYNNR